MRPRRAVAFQIDAAEGVARRILAQALELRPHTAHPQLGVEQRAAPRERAVLFDRPQIRDDAHRLGRLGGKASAQQADPVLDPQVDRPEGRRAALAREEAELERRRRTRAQARLERLALEVDRRQRRLDQTEPDRDGGPVLHIVDRRAPPAQRDEADRPPHHPQEPRRRAEEHVGGRQREEGRGPARDRPDGRRHDARDGEHEREAEQRPDPARREPHAGDGEADHAGAGRATLLGTSTAARIRSRAISRLTPSTSASGRTISRCASTSGATAFTSLGVTKSRPSIAAAAFLVRLCRGAILNLMPKARERSKSQLKRIGPSGQIALGKEFAGRTAVVEEVEQGVWVVKLGQFVPDSERWLWQNDVQGSLERAEAYASAHPAQTSDLDALEQEARLPHSSRSGAGE